MNTLTKTSRNILDQIDTIPRRIFSIDIESSIVESLSRNLSALIETEVAGQQHNSYTVGELLRSIAMMEELALRLQKYEIHVPIFDSITGNLLKIKPDLKSIHSRLPDVNF